MKNKINFKVLKKEIKLCNFCKGTGISIQNTIRYRHTQQYMTKCSLSDRQTDRDRRTRQRRLADADRQPKMYLTDT